MKIAIVGGRDFNDYELLERKIGIYLNLKLYDWSSADITIVSGGAKGADSLGERFADFFGFKTEIFKPDWNTFGKQAGFLRNIQIIDNADIVFAFWDGKSKGTQHSINLARQKDKELHIVRYDNEK